MNTSLSLSKIMRVINIQLSKTIVGAKFIATLIVICPYLFIEIHQVSKMCSTLGYKCSIYLFPFLSTDSFARFFLCGCAILMFSDTPFLDNNQLYVILRVGRKNWILGIIGYLFVFSLLFVLALVVLSIVFLFPNISFESGWGKIIGTLASTDAAINFQIPIIFSRFVFLNYTPVEAMVLSISIHILVFTFLGSLLLFCNLWFQKIVGVSVCFLLLILSLFAIEAVNRKIFYLSPISWLSLDQIRYDQLTQRPTLFYCLFFLCFFIISFNTLSYIRSQKSDLIIENSKNEV